MGIHNLYVEGLRLHHNVITDAGRLCRLTLWDSSALWVANQDSPEIYVE